MSQVHCDDSQGSISRLVGAVDVALPGEDQAQFERDVEVLQRQYGAYGPLQRYFAEKICERMWWIRRYEGLKRQMLHSNAGLVSQQFEWVDPELRSSKGKDMSLRALDERIAQEFNFLSKFVNMLESLLSKPMRSRRMHLQVMLLEQKLGCTDVTDLA